MHVRRVDVLRALAAMALTSVASACATRRDALPGARFSDDGLHALNVEMAAAIERGEVKGIATLLLHNGQEVTFQAAGERNAVTRAPMTRDTIFRIYSMTKPITAVAMMILYQEGKWRLDDPISAYLPEMAALRVARGVDASGAPVIESVHRAPTMRELMTHTAGFAYGMPDGRIANTLFGQANVPGSTDMRDFVNRVAELPLQEQPGVEWAYSIAVDLQGAIIERLSGQTLSAFMRARIFAPLGMHDTGFVVPPQDSARLADIYDTDPTSGALVRTLPQPTGFGSSQDYSRQPSVESGGGGLVSTIDDYARFAQMILNDGILDGARILRAEIATLMSANHVDHSVLNHSGAAGRDFGPTRGFGLGFMVETDPEGAGRPEGRGTLSWTGAAGTWFWIDPANDIVFVGMVQRMDDPTRQARYASSRRLVYTALERGAQ
ncbi:MAG TPA: serine hydrolase domain-containing protein [Verrucomicrobiae bacterium]|nr:serine hydrolase domain-containing protein [Verrucomicrobiae bacterium]